MNKYLIGLLITGAFIVPANALEGVAVIDLRTAVLATQAAKNAFENLEEEAEYSGNLEQARVLQTDRQTLAEKLQKEADTLSQEEITDIQRSIQEKSKDLEFIVGKIQTKQNETADKVFRDLNSSVDARSIYATIMARVLDTDHRKIVKDAFFNSDLPDMTKRIFG